MGKLPARSISSVIPDRAGGRCSQSGRGLYAARNDAEPDRRGRVCGIAPFLAQETADTFGLLFVHYQTPLIDCDDLYMMTKKGTYTPCSVASGFPSRNEPDELYRLNSQVWSEQRFAIAADGKLALQWSYDSDWKPEPQAVFEPVFQPALAGALIAVPGAGGALWELDRMSGEVVRHVMPVGTAIDPDTYVAGGVSVGSDGTITATFDFGWDSTPAVFGGPDDYKIIIKDNHYGVDANNVDHGPFLISELDSSLHIVWSFQSTNTKTCARQDDGSITCTDDHPHGFEWCINAPAVDRDGTVYANSEDGNTYAITPDGKLRDSVFLDRAFGAAYTPIALDHLGRVFALNAGRLTVLGQ